MKKIHKVLGLMSGTSLDGLDIAYCHIWQVEKNKWNFKILNAETISYSKAYKNKLKNAILISKNKHSELDIAYGEWLGLQAKKFIENYNCDIDFIASHGHTTHHKPEEGYTYQIGNGQKLANSAEQKVICDFRSLDVKLGGQGAPLVPIGDELLFSDYDFCLNLGGISNISFKKNKKRIAYDIGLANMPLNYITEKIQLSYDDEGKLAASGKLDEALFNQLNNLNYYKLPFPKSTGYEWFAKEIIPLIEKSTNTPKNLLHTFIHHNCTVIASAIKKHKTTNENRILVCGGGALNTFFMSNLSKKLEGFAHVIIPSKELINYKEALVFVLMGVKKNRNEINVFSSVTGASKDSCSGTIFIPN